MTEPILWKISVKSCGLHQLEGNYKKKWLLRENTFIRDFCYCQMDTEEIMRRVPGITRKEVKDIYE